MEKVIPPNATLIPIPGPDGLCTKETDETVYVVKTYDSAPKDPKKVKDYYLKKIRQIQACTLSDGFPYIQQLAGWNFMLPDSYVADLRKTGQKINQNTFYCLFEKTEDVNCSDINSKDKYKLLLHVIHALKFLHSIGVIYRNLSDNTIKKVGDDYVLTDMMESKQLSSEQSNTFKPSESKWIDPKRTNQTADVQTSTGFDIYSFGVLVDHIIHNGANPDKVSTEGATKQCQDPIDSLETLVRRCLSPFNRISAHRICQILDSGYGESGQPLKILELNVDTFIADMAKEIHDKETKFNNSHSMPLMLTIGIPNEEQITVDKLFSMDENDRNIEVEKVYQSANAGNTSAMEYLAEMYQFGIIIPEDWYFAYDWYSKVKESNPKSEALYNKFANKLKNSLFGKGIILEHQAYHETDPKRQQGQLSEALKYYKKSFEEDHDYRSFARIAFIQRDNITDEIMKTMCKIYYKSQYVTMYFGIILSKSKVCEEKILGFLFLLSISLQGFYKGYEYAFQTGASLQFNPDFQLLSDFYNQSFELMQLRGMFDANSKFAKQIEKDYGLDQILESMGKGSSQATYLYIKAVKSFGLN